MRLVQGGCGYRRTFQLPDMMVPELQDILKQDTRQIGKLAAQKLIDLIERPKTTLIEQIVVKGEVFAGTSVKKI